MRVTLQEDLHWIHLELGRASASESGGRGPAAEGDPRFKSAEVLAELEQCVTASRQRQDPPAPSPKVPHNFTITIIIIEKKKSPQHLAEHLLQPRPRPRHFSRSAFFPTLEDRNRNRRSALGLFFLLLLLLFHLLDIFFGSDRTQSSRRTCMDTAAPLTV